MKNTPLVSVILPTYNRTRYLGQTIESVLAQTYANYEIIVVDDGSTCDVKTALTPYMNNTPIRYIYQANQGLAAARNTGMRHANGEYLAFLDDDDLLEPRKFEIQLSLFADNPELGLVYSDCYEFETHSPENLVINHAVGRDRPVSEFPQLFFVQPNVRVPTWLVSQACVEHIGGFDEHLRFHQDGDWVLRIALEWPVAFSAYPSARVRHHSDNRSSNRREMYQAILQSAQNILTRYPAFARSLGKLAQDRLAEVYYDLAKTSFKQCKIREGIAYCRKSRQLSPKYLNLARIGSRLLQRWRNRETA